MTVTNLDIVRAVITIILLVFHCSVTWFIFLMMKIRKDKSYTSQFFILYLIISITDILTVINNFMIKKVLLIDSWKPWFLTHPEWNTVFWLFSGYLIYFQSLLHAAIALNRVWMSFYVFTTNSMASKIGKFGIWLLPFVALAIVAPRIRGSSYFLVTKDNELAGVYVENHIQMYYSITGPSVVLSTALICFIFAVTTILRYRYLFQQHHNKLGSTIKHDLVLFFQALIVLLFQLALAGYYIIVIVAQQNNLPNLLAFAYSYFNYVTDALSLCNPIALLIVCKFIRQDYFKWLCRG